MRDRTIVPTNLLNWPRVEPLITEQKFILLALWAAPWLSCAGVGELPLRAFSTCLGLSHEATEAGLKYLIEAGLIGFDRDTNEVFVLDWFRFHKFDNGKTINGLNCAVSKIQSQTIKNMVAEKSRTYLPTATTTATTTINKTIKALPKIADAIYRPIGQDVVEEIKSKSKSAEQEELSIKNRVSRTLPLVADNRSENVSDGGSDVQPVKVVTATPAEQGSSGLPPSFGAPPRRLR